MRVGSSATSPTNTGPHFRGQAQDLVDRIRHAEARPSRLCDSLSKTHEHAFPNSSSVSEGERCSPNDPIELGGLLGRAAAHSSYARVRTHETNARMRMKRSEIVTKKPLTLTAVGRADSPFRHLE